MSIHSIDAASAQPLSRERMKAIKGGGSNADGSNITMSIVTACNNGCGKDKIEVSCSCY